MVSPTQELPTETGHGAVGSASLTSLPTSPPALPSQACWPSWLYPGAGWGLESGDFIFCLGPLPQPSDLCWLAGWLGEPVLSWFWPAVAVPRATLSERGQASPWCLQCVIGSCECPTPTPTPRSSSAPRGQVPAGKLHLMGGL